MSVLEIVNCILTERERQDAKWGEQNHPDGTGPEYREAAALQKECVDRLAAQGTLLWSEILLEEIYEAYSETDPEKLVEELIHSMAVTWAWIEAIRRRDSGAVEAVFQQAMIIPSTLVTESVMPISEDVPA